MLKHFNDLRCQLNCRAEMCCILPFSSFPHLPFSHLTPSVPYPFISVCVCLIFALPHVFLSSFLVSPVMPPCFSLPHHLQCLLMSPCGRPPLASCCGLHPIQDNGAVLQGHQRNCTHLPRNAGQATCPSMSTSHYYIS